LAIQCVCDNHVWAVGFTGDFLGRKIEEIMSPFNSLQIALFIMENLHAYFTSYVKSVRKA
jgi:hypothetical protein